MALPSRGRETPPSILSGSAPSPDAASPPFRSARRIAWALGAAAALAVVATIDDPGMTVDEPLDVRPGRAYVATLRATGWRFFTRPVSDRVYLDNKEHPPLGRWLLGIASTLGETAELIVLGRDPVGTYVRSGRLAPALAFGLLVGLVAAEAGRRYGRVAGAAAGFALAVMPRAFAHAHIAALDTFITLFWTWAFLKAARAIESERPVRAMAVAGLVWGLALLTKIHAWLLPPVVGVWALARLRPGRAVAAMAAWAAVGLAVFFVGWPWLWYDPARRLAEYLGTGVVRVPIRVTYFGRVFVDRDVPWHYPWVFFVATVPVGLHALGAIGEVVSLRAGRSDPFGRLLVGTTASWLLLFSTRVPVYDGERLFLPVFPLWAILIGRGFAAAWGWADGRRWARVGLVAATVGQGYGVVAIHPFGLSYYNLAVGGLKGAERLGLELTYWGDAVDRVLLDRLAREAAAEAGAALAPTLAPDQGKVATTRDLARKRIALQDQEAVPNVDWVVVSRRPAYWSPAVRALVASAPPVAVRARQGVWLSGLWRVDRGKPFNPN